MTREQKNNEKLLINDSKSNNLEVKSNNEIERNEMAEIIAKNSVYSGEAWYASDYEWAAHCLQEKGYRKQAEGEWISVEDRLPEPEKEVLILTIRRYMCYGEVREISTITTAIYEDGTMSTEDSFWNWYDIDFIYDEENDVQYIPEGWWEFRHYNPDDVYNNAVDDKVTHWMPLPEPPKGT